MAIECDEAHHNYKKQLESDKLRMESIKDKLSCDFIRFRPYDKNFDIFDVISQIYDFIKNQINKET